ncbi:hypothetical protein EMIHUDRAFT_55830, partial [Emiliania huxleyi CCMP1516]|uniref:Proteasome subunit alpha type n=2 Tax=Emiliania huxleyi TaxID=2903 RepID=A0A0D3JEY2_EMIH1
MSSIGTGYDQSTTTFSPDGRVFQIEYAAKAVENSGTAIGIRCKDGVVLGVEKQKLSKMMLPGSNRRIYTVDKCTGIAVSGMMADARQARWPRATAAALFRHLLAAIVNAARAESANHTAVYGGQIPGAWNMLSDKIAALLHMYTLYWYVRPFGSSV